MITIRKSESNSSQLSVEELQGGYIFRFNEIQVEKINDTFNNNLTIIFECDEVWVDNLSDLINNLPVNCVLNNDQQQYISLH